MVESLVLGQVLVWYTLLVRWQEGVVLIALVIESLACLVPQ